MRLARHRKDRISRRGLALILASLVLPVTVSAQATGPLRVSARNPRYFADGSDRIVVLSGSHTWSVFQDNGGSDPPPVFNYAGWLDFLQSNGHNFFRMWTWEQSRWSVSTEDTRYWFSPQTPYVRTGPGNARDGKLRFNLDSLDQSFFDRLRARVLEAENRGIYVAVMLFNGWSVASQKGPENANNPWNGHPFNRHNNVNGVDGDVNNDDSGEETHELASWGSGDTTVTQYQKAYVKKVIDTVNDLDNVLYEISNESHSNSQDWQYNMVNFIKEYELTKPKQHPVGMTVEYPGGDNGELFLGGADWVSLNGGIDNPPATTGTKVILLDTDHLCGVCGDRQWVWKSFTRGHNPIFMDGYDGAAYGCGGAGFDSSNAQWVSVRSNLGYVLSYARRMDLGATTPQSDLSSTGYCLAQPSGDTAEFLVYRPESSGDITLDLSLASDTLTVEWFNPDSGTTTPGGTTTGGGSRTFSSPFAGDAVLYVYGRMTVQARVKVLLEGAYDIAGNSMRNTLNTGGALAAHFPGVPIPSGAVDSITVEIRDSPGMISSTVRKLRPAWLMANGTIRDFSDTAASIVKFDTVPGSYYIVVWHRNHLAVMSSSAQYLSPGAAQEYDFTTGQNQAYGSDPMKVIGSRTVMVAGDVNNSGVVSAADVNIILGWLNATGYRLSDANLSGIVTAADANLVLSNLLRFSQVP